MSYLVDAMRKRAPKGTVKGIRACPTCSNLYENKTGKKKYCSRQCFPTEQKSCIVCCAEFTSRKKSEKYCSSDCSKTASKNNVAEAKALLAENNPNSYIECKICNTFHKQLASHLKNNHNITSEEYRTKFNNDTVSKDTSAKYSELIGGENNPWFNHGGKMSPFSKAFVAYEGLSEQQIDEQRNKVIRKANDGAVKANSLQYFLNQGYSESEAKLLLKERQTTFSLKKCIDKYGDEEGLRRWQDRQEKWQKTLLAKPFDEQEDINQRKIWKSGSMSKIAEDLFYNLDIKGARYGKKTQNNLGEKMEIICVNGKDKRTMIDYVYGNKIIEFYGDYWHANPKKFNCADKIFKRRNGYVTAKDINVQDANRENELRKLGYEIKVVWESDYRKDKNGVIRECLAFLNN